MDLYTFICATSEIANKAEGIARAEMINNEYIRNPHYICSQFYKEDNHYKLEIVATESLVQKFESLFAEEQLRWSSISSLDVRMRKPTTKSQPNLVARLVFRSSLFRH